MQFRVPKFLEREATIAFGLTFKNLAILGGLGLVSFLLYYIIPSKILFIFVVLILGAIFFAFSFVKFRGQKLFEIITNSFSFFFSPRTYLWQKKEGLKPIKIIKKERRGERKEEPLRLAPRSRLGEIRSKIDLGPR